MSQQPPANQPGPEHVIDRPVGTEDLTAELKQTKRSVNRLTIGLGAAVVLVAVFFGGVATHAALADEPATAGARPGQGSRPGGVGVPGQGGGVGARGTIGTIDRIEGGEIYVKTPDGRTVKVSTSDSTEVRVSQEGELADLQTGLTVVVQGSTGSDGTVTAQTITQQPGDR
jgi:hypothetical protein